MTLTLFFLISVFAISHNVARTPRIMRGQIAAPGEIPYQVSLQGTESETRLQYYFCGGIILNKKFILTAAHCMFKPENRNEKKAAEGLYAIVGTIDLLKPYAEYPIESYYIHENFSWHPVSNDIALVKVKFSFVFFTLVSAVKLPQQDQAVKTDAVAFVSGYGQLSYQGNLTTKLRVARIQIIDQSYCKRIYKRLNTNIRDTQICANEPSIERGACEGDSGGPLIVDGELVGIASQSVSCSNTEYPDVYTRVSSYINWIKQHANMK